MKAPVVLIAAATSASALVVDIPGLGSVKGSIGLPSIREVAFFGGIPFAKPPVGDLRWQPPVPHGPFDSPRGAGWKDIGSQCSQGSSGSEDCLYLNIGAPTKAIKESKKLPVMFWIHGGSYTDGSGSFYSPWADELIMRSKDQVVAVTVNYRLNVFGFLASKDLQARSSDGSVGNLGIQDQRLAMQWVQQHIGAFGGDGNSIAIFGESAGGNSVFNHLAQPASFPFYRRAIVESGAYNEGAKMLADAEADYDHVLKVVGCKDLACLLTKDTASLSKAKNAGDWGPVVDGINLKDKPAALIDAGKHNVNATVMIGSNADENASPWFEGGSIPLDLNETGFDIWLAQSLASKNSSAMAKEVKALYDPAVYEFPKHLGKYSQWWWTATRIATDQVPGLGTCGVRWLAEKLSRAGSETYAYIFARPCQTIASFAIPGCGLGSVVAPHAGEIPYVFGDFLLTLPPQDRELAKHSSQFWSSFAVTGEPAVAGLPAWPRYDEKQDSLMHFDVKSEGGIRAEAHTRKAVCDYWEARNHMASGQEALTPVVV